MLQQIIESMYIEPDLLAELSDEQKQVIFCKIREEQVRRWKVTEDALGKKPQIAKKPQKSGSKTLSWLLASDNQPWVWVMGEHPDDKSIDDIIEEEIHGKARAAAELEAAGRRKQEEIEMQQKLVEEEKRLQQEKEKREAELAALKKKAEAERAADDLKKKNAETQQKIAQLKAPKRMTQRNITPLCKRHSVEEIQLPGASSSSFTFSSEQVTLNNNRQGQQTYELDGESYDVTSPKKPCDPTVCDFCYKEKSEKARLSREASYRDLKTKRTNEILDNFKKTKSLWEQKAKENNDQLEKDWRKQEEKSKRADFQRRSLARSAREELNSQRRDKPKSMAREVFRESAVLLGNALTAVKSNGSQTKRINHKKKPDGKMDIQKWFIEEEKLKNVGLNKQGAVEKWFHGIISRQESENLLENEPTYSFLVRVSEKIWGYALSYKSEDRCKHYLVDITDEGYQFFGMNQLEHASLNELVNYHKNHPVSSLGQELLKFPVGQSRSPPDYSVLFPDLVESTSL